MLIINTYKSVHSCVTKVYILVVQGCTLMHNMIVHFAISLHLMNTDSLNYTDFNKTE